MVFASMGASGRLRESQRNPLSSQTPEFDIVGRLNGKLLVGYSSTFHPTLAEIQIGHQNAGGFKSQNLGGGELCYDLELLGLLGELKSS